MAGLGKGPGRPGEPPAPHPPPPLILSLKNRRIFFLEEKLVGQAKKDCPLPP